MRQCCCWAGATSLLIVSLIPACGKNENDAAEASGTAVGGVSVSRPVDSASASRQFSLAGPGPRPSDNSLCFVCHQGLAKESITTAHSAKDVLCVDCHGRSTLHMEDEMLMTEPDVVYGRNEVEALCRKCHGPHQDPVKVEKFREEWYGRDRPNGRVVNMRSICTDCHGEHNVAGKIAKAGSTVTKDEEEWIDLFNGSDLTGWRTDGQRHWAATSGGIEGRSGTGTADLLTEREYGDFLLAVTYRVEWPCAAGIWLRHRSGGEGYRVEIVEQHDPELYSGTLVIPGREPLLVSRDPQLVDREGWNTISVKAQGNHIEVFLNGHEIGRLEDSSFSVGRVGFHIRSEPGPGVILISEVKLQLLQGKGSRSESPGSGVRTDG